MACWSHGTPVDHSFIDTYANGFQAWSEHVRTIDWPFVQTTTGLTRAQITEAAQIIRESTATIWCWAMGLTQHRNAVATIKEVVNLALVRGDIGKRGAGLRTVQGHSNVQVIARFGCGNGCRTASWTPCGSRDASGIMPTGGRPRTSSAHRD